MTKEGTSSEEFILRAGLEKSSLMIRLHKGEVDKFLVEICRLRWLNVAKMFFRKALQFSGRKVLGP